MQTDYKSKQSGGALSADEIAKLALSPEDKTALQSAEKYTVTYGRERVEGGGRRRAVPSRRARAAVAPYAAQSENDATQTVYALTMQDGSVKYYTPLPAVGEYITYSYFASVLDYEKYLNCTYESVSYDLTEGVNVPADGFVTDLQQYTFDQAFVFAYGKTAGGENVQKTAWYLHEDHYKNRAPAYSEDDTQNPIVTEPSYIDNNDRESENYIVERDSELRKVHKSYSLQTEYSAEILTDTFAQSVQDELFELGFELLFWYGDCADFIKTATGFRFDGEDVSAHERTDPNTQVITRSTSKDIGTVQIDLQDGHMTQVRLFRKDCEIEETKEENGSYTTVSEEYNGARYAVLRFTDFGTTTVVIPADIEAQLSALTAA